MSPENSRPDFNLSASANPLGTVARVKALQAVISPGGQPHTPASSIASVRDTVAASSLRARPAGAAPAAVSGPSRGAEDNAVGTLSAAYANLPPAVVRRPWGTVETVLNAPAEQLATSAVQELSPLPQVRQPRGWAHSDKPGLLILVLVLVLSGIVALPSAGHPVVALAGGVLSIGLFSYQQHRLAVQRQRSVRNS